MAQFIAKGRVKYNGKMYVSGQVVEVAEKDVADFKKHGWEIVKDKKQEDAGKQDYSKLTVAQMKEVLTEKGIEFDDNAKKAELLALLQA